MAAGLGVVGTDRFLNGPQGYDPDGVLAMKLALPDRAYHDAASQRRFVERAIDALAIVPDVERAAVINNPPASGSNSARVIEIDGHPAPDPKNPPEVDNRLATADYFTIMRISIGAGRGFSSADREGTAPVVIVSESMARKYWPGENPLGRRLKIANGPWITVLRLAVGQAMRLTLVGTGIGLALAIALRRLMETAMLGVASSSAAVFVTFASVLAGTAFLAGYLPARRAASTDPMIALRAE